MDTARLDFRGRVILRGGVERAQAEGERGERARSILFMIVSEQKIVNLDLDELGRALAQARAGTLFDNNLLTTQWIFKMHRLAPKQLRLLARLPHSAARLEGDRRAVVAALCRRGAADSGLEVLFIVRATHPSSRWSGQVGFPGGHVEAGESDA